MYPQQIGGPISALPIVQISCNMLHNVAADIEGHVWTWGWGGRGRLGHGNDVSVSAPKVVKALDHESVIQDMNAEVAESDSETLNGSVVAMEDVRMDKLLRMSIVVQVCCGAEHTLSRTRGGQIFAWGENSVGQLGEL
jgi:alpha-tubulin suppressor-like RCC1 family protein